jgi:isopentenyl phosphate kinase
MLIFVKLGGSVITDKTGQEAPDLATIRGLAAALRAALDGAAPGDRLIVGHGSGSFGHTYARRYGVHTGIAAGGDWMGFALTAAAALRLNRIVVDELLAAGVPAISFQPSATLVAERGAIVGWDTGAIARALDHGLVPVVHGDVAFDTVQGSAIISTEQLLEALALTADLRPARVVLVGEAGVYTDDPRANRGAQRIPRIDAANIAAVLRGAGGSHGADVTGGMRAKVELAWRLVQAIPGLAVQLVGPEPTLVTRALLGQAAGEGTLIAERTELYQ